MFCLKTFGRVFHFTNFQLNISRYRPDVETTGRVFYHRFWNLVMKRFCIISDGSYIFMFYIIKNCVCFLTPFIINIFWMVHGVKWHQLASERRQFFQLTWSLRGFFRKSCCFFVVAAIAQNHLLVVPEFSKVSNIVTKLQDKCSQINTPEKQMLDCHLWKTFVYSTCDSVES